MKVTSGRLVHYFPGHGDQITRHGQDPLAAVVAAVWSPDRVSLCVFDAMGVPQPRPKIPFVEDATIPPMGPYCTWPKQDIPAPLLMGVDPAQGQSQSVVSQVAPESEPAGATHGAIDGVEDF